MVHLPVIQLDESGVGVGQWAQGLAISDCDKLLREAVSGALHLTRTSQISQPGSDSSEE